MWTSVQSVPLRVGVKLEKFDEDEETGSWPFRELVGGLMWLAISTRPDIFNAVRSVAGYCSPPKPSTGNRRLVFLHTSMVLLLVLSLHTSEGHSLSGFITESECLDSFSLLQLDAFNAVGAVSTPSPPAPTRCKVNKQ